MNYNIKGTELDITDELRTYVEKRLAQADKFVGADSTAHADVELAHSPVRDGKQYRAEFTVSCKGQVYRAEEWGTALHEAIDLAAAELTSELSRDKKKHLSIVRRSAAKAKDMMRFWR
jgi:putative sigma-54 modulation protein